MLQAYPYQRLLKIAKYVLLLAISGFIFYKLIYAYKIDQLFREFSRNDHTTSLWFLFMAISLVWLNWGIESIKWKYLIEKFEKVSFWNSYKAVLSGVTLSIITPNQIGDIAGRIIHLQVLNKIKGSLIMVIGHTAQMLITCFFGIFALWFFWGQQYGIFLPLLSIVIMSLSIFVYLDLKRVFSKIETISWVRHFEKYLNVFASYTPGELLKVLFISFVRYLVFLAQYYFLLKFFDVQVEPFQAIICIMAIFCIQSVVPSFLLLELGLRGASALFVFNWVGIHSAGILLTAYSLWIINIMIPALFGMWFIYKVK